MKKIISSILVLFVALIPVARSEAQNLGNPRLMLTEYRVEAEDLFAGDSTNLHLTIKNVNAGGAASNIALTINSMESSIITEGINTTFIQHIPAWDEDEWVLPIKVLETTVPGIHNLSLTIDYQDQFGGSYSSEAQIQLEVLPETRFAHDDLKYVDEIIHGENMEFSLNVMNLGKNSISNVLLEAQIPGASEGVSSLVGSLAAGTNQVMSVAFNVRDSIEVGDYEGHLTLSYEDELGKTYYEEFPVKFAVEERLSLQTLPDEEDTEETALSPTYLYIALGVVVILLILLIIQSVRLRKLQAEANARL